MKSTYIYVGKNLLSHRNDYAYSQFHGKQFINDWEKSRVKILKKLPLIEVSMVYDENIQSSYYDINGNYITHKLLSFLAYQLQSNNLDENSDCLLKLVQRFEVSKRIHNSYSQLWKPIDQNAFHSYELYILYSEVMMLAYLTYKRLDFLNVWLKVNDTLISIYESLNLDNKARLATILNAEVSTIKNFTSSEFN